MEKIIKALFLICLMTMPLASNAQKLIEDLSEDEVTIVYKNAADQSTMKGEHKQSGRMIKYEPGKFITIVTNQGDTITYLQENIYRIQRKRPYNMAFTSKFGEGGPQRGYHGEYNFEMVARTSPLPYGFSTVQGYQIFPWLRLGAGYQFLYASWTNEEPLSGEKNTVTAHSNVIFGDAKVFFTRTLFNPFLDLRLGSSLDKGQGFYYNVSVGCRFGLRSSKRLAFNFSMGIAQSRNTINTNTDRKADVVIRGGFEF